MTQTTHDFVEREQIPPKTHQSGHEARGNIGLGFFCAKCLHAWLKIFHSTFSNHLDGFS
jgi:hypothetical protein